MGKIGGLGGGLNAEKRSQNREDGSPIDWDSAGRGSAISIPKEWDLGFASIPGDWDFRFASALITSYFVGCALYYIRSCMSSEFFWR